MPTLILYASKSGAAKESAALLAKELPESTVCSFSGPVPDISAYGTVIIGSGVRMGRMYKAARLFLKQNEAGLAKKRIAFFLCNAEPSLTQGIIEKNIPAALAAKALAVQSFGGKPPFRSAAENWLIAANFKAFVAALK